jgi:hypothetical protein
MVAAKGTAAQVQIVVAVADGLVAAMIPAGIMVNTAVVIMVIMEDLTVAGMAVGLTVVATVADLMEAVADIEGNFNHKFTQSFFHCHCRAWD